MRYLVTGAAGFIGSHLSEALRAEGHEVVGLDCFTDYYDVALKEENARGQEILRLDLARDPIDLAGFDGVFHLAGQPGVRSFGDVFETYLERNVLASQRLFEAAARDGVRVVFASSSSVYGDAEAYPTAETRSSAAGVALRDHEAHLRAPGACDREEASASTSSWPRYFNAYGPRQRPDMAFTRIAMCLAEGRPFDLFGDGLQSRSFTYVADVVRGTIAGDGSRQRHLQRRRRRGGDDARHDRDVRGARRPPARDPRPPGRAGRPAAHEGRHDADPQRARLGADDVACGTVSRPNGSGPLLGSRRDERDANRPIPTPSARSISVPRGRGSRRAGTCPSPGS